MGALGAIVVVIVVILVLTMGVNAVPFINWRESAQPTPTMMASSSEGCRQIEYRAVKHVGSKGRATVEAYRYYLQALWCWDDGAISETRVLRRNAEIGGIPGWSFTGHSSDLYEVTNGVGDSSWSAWSVGEFAFCVPVSFSVPQAAGLGLSGSMCPMDESVLIEVQVDAQGNYSARCEDLECELVSVGDVQYRPDD